MLTTIGLYSIVKLEYNCMVTAHFRITKIYTFVLPAGMDFSAEALL